jgi:hypothetical protein
MTYDATTAWVKWWQSLSPDEKRRRRIRALELREEVLEQRLKQADPLPAENDRRNAWTGD